MAHSKNCILRESCKLADSEKCNVRCSAYIQLHGISGTGGRVGAANVPKDYRLLTVKNAPVRDKQSEAYKKIEMYVKTFARQFTDERERLLAEGKSENEVRTKSLYLYSPSPGNGKTTSAVAILNAYLITHYVGSVKRGIAPKQRPCYFLDVNEWQELYNELNRQGVPQERKEKAGAEYYRRMDNAKQSAFVVFDDIGVRQATDGFRGDLHSVINHRVTNGLPSVYTSNIAIEDLKDVFDERLYDRVRDLCVEIEFRGSSRRGLRK